MQSVDSLRPKRHNAFNACLPAVKLDNGLLSSHASDRESGAVGIAKAAIKAQEDHGSQ